MLEKGKIAKIKLLDLIYFVNDFWKSLSIVGI